MENKDNQPPIKVFRSGPIKFAVWLNTVTRDGEEVKFHSLKITKVYRDKNSGEWKNSNRLFVDDLPKVAMLATKVCSELGIQIYEPKIQSDEENETPEHDSNEEFNSGQM